MFTVKYKPRRCQFRKCRETFNPQTAWQRFCCVAHRETEKRRRKDGLVRKAQRIIEAQEKVGAA